MNGPRKKHRGLTEPHLPPGEEISSVSSATDFTGLIPAEPDSKEKLTAYEDLYPFDANPGK